MPDEDRARSTPLTFRASYEELVGDMGAAALLIAAAFTLGFAVWALIDLGAADAGYFRLARFHAHLEIMACALMFSEARPCAKFRRVDVPS